MQELVTSPVASAKPPHHLQHRPTLLLLLLWEIPDRCSTGGYSSTCCCNSHSQSFGGTVVCCPKNTCKVTPVTVLLMGLLLMRPITYLQTKQVFDCIFTLQKVQAKGGGHQSPSPHGLKTHCTVPETSKLLSCIHPPI